MFHLTPSRLNFRGRDVSSSLAQRGALFARNLTDRRYSTGSVDFGFAAMKIFPERRTIGVEGKVEF